MARKDLLRDLLGAPETGPEVDSRQLSGTRAGGVDGRQLPAPEAEAAGKGDGRRPAPSPRAAGAGAPGLGAIGAVGRSIADLKARALVEIDPALIDEGGLADRLGADPEDDARLLASIREHGQQVPVLARPHPGAPGRYQIVYGRRRARALAALGRPVKALVRDLDDRGLLIAQGQENSARRDLSFIEKANFARQMLAAGFDRATAQAALSTDKTQLSRMLSVAERLPGSVIAAIGAAPGIGRDRWRLLAELYTGVAPTEAAALAATGWEEAGQSGTNQSGANQSGGSRSGADRAGPGPGPSAAGVGQTGPGGNAALGEDTALGGDAGSDARFEALEAWLRARAAAPRASRHPRFHAARAEAAPPPSPELLRAEDGGELAILMRNPERVALILGKRERAFADWLVTSLPALHARFRAEAAEES